MKEKKFSELIENTQPSLKKISFFANKISPTFKNDNKKTTITKKWKKGKFYEVKLLCLNIHCLMLFLTLRERLSQDRIINITVKNKLVDVPSSATNFKNLVRNQEKAKIMCHLPLKYVL